MLRGRLDEARAQVVPVGSMGSFFGALEPSLRRPVEILGLLHLAAELGWLEQESEPEEQGEAYAAVRPDGTRRTFDVPRTPVPDPDLPPDLPPDQSVEDQQ